MLLGIVGTAIGFGIIVLFKSLAGAETSWEAGIGGAFIFAIIYMVSLGMEALLLDGGRGFLYYI